MLCAVVVDDPIIVRNDRLREKTRKKSINLEQLYFPTLKFTTLYFNFHLVQKQPFSGDMVDSHSNFSRDLEMMALGTRLVKFRIYFFSALFPCGQKGAASLSSVMQKSYQSLNISFVKPSQTAGCYLWIPTCFFGVFILFLYCFVMYCFETLFKVAVKVNGSDVKLTRNLCYFEYTQLETY